MNIFARKSGFVIFGMTFALLFICSSLPASALEQESAGEAALLSSWKAKAKESTVGNQLIAILNSTSYAIKSGSGLKQSLKQSFYLRGYLFGIIGCTYSALADLNKALEIDPSYAAAYTERGICYMDLKNYEKARDDLNRALSLNPYSGDARLARGKLMLELDKPQAAENDFRCCLSASTRFTPALPGELPANYYNAAEYYLGVCEEAVGRPDSALKHYKAASKSRLMGGSGYIKRYSDQPLDASYRASRLESGL